MPMNIFRFAGDMTHLMSIIVRDSPFLRLVGLTSFGLLAGRGVESTVEINCQGQELNGPSE